MKDRIYLLVRCTVETSHCNIHDAIAEFQEHAHVQLTSTPKVRIITTEIIKLNTRKNKK